MRLLRPNQSHAMSAHDAAHILGALGSIVGAILVINAAWSPK